MFTQKITVIRRLFYFLLFFCLVGCSGFQIPVNNLELSAKTPVIDMRPPEEGTQEIFSLLIMSEDYGYIRITERATNPTGARLFAHRLQEKYGSKPVPVTKLHHFVIYMNARNEMVTSSLSAGIGAAAGYIPIGPTPRVTDSEAFNTMVDPAEFSMNSGQNEYKRAIYSPSEWPAGTSTYLVFIETETEGVHRFTKTVAPRFKKDNSNGLHEALEAAIKFHIDY